MDTMPFVIRAPPRHHRIGYVDQIRSPTVLSSRKESDSVEKIDVGANIENGPAAVPNPTFQMGASIGAENVSKMLFNEEILKGGRGDVRVGSIGRWKDFKGNDIVRNQDNRSE
jgi:hypothetical protein